MKKYFKSLLPLLALMISIISLSQKVEAKDDLYIPNWVVDAKLFEDGRLQIVEDITFEFNTDFNGVYREIILDKTSGVTEIKVQEVAGEIPKDYKQVDAADNGDSDVYTIAENRNKILIKIFSPSEDEKKTFRISYFVNNVAVKYNDTGELYYKFLGDENETAIGKFTVNLYLPKSDTNNKVKLYAHGPSNGQTSKKSDTFYQMQVEKVPVNTFIEARILFPTDFIELSDNIQSIDRYDQIIQEENAFQSELSQDQERKEALRNVLNGINLVVSSIVAFILVFIMLKCRRRLVTSSNIDNTKIPQECTPAIASLIIGMISSSSVIFATILDLFRKGYLRISGEKDNHSVLDNNSFVIHKIKVPDQNLLTHERYFMSWLFDEIGNKHSVSTGDIENFSKHNNSKFINSFTTWKNKVKLDAVQKGYYETNKTKQGSILLVLSFVLILLGIFSAIEGSPLAVLSFIVAVITIVYSLVLFNRLSDYGYGEYRKWMGFRTYMKNNRPDLSKEAVINSLDLSLIYAFGLGITSKQSYGSGYTAGYSANSWIFWYFLFINTDNNTFKKSMDDSFNSAFVSADSSGSFSAGGGGGAGGGGAGGF